MVNRKTEELKAKKRTDKKVAVIGSGPALRPQIF